MKTIQQAVSNRQDYPIRVVQFGEGNFLRAFVDYMLDIANEKGVFGGSVAVVKPISFGNLERFHKQDNLYTVILRGKENGNIVDDARIVTSVSESLDCAEDYDAFMALAAVDTLRFVVSNTTEAGIVLNEQDHFDGLPESYPGKLTKFLYARYEATNGDPNKGLVMLPVELIENNGKKLKECVLALAKIWQLPADFTRWVEQNNVFCSTLVDRIVTGYPRAEAEALCEKLGYQDDLLDVGEPFALWVIESDRDIQKELPLDTIGLPVIFTDDQRPYRERKVRVLNGAHTASVLMAYLNGFDIVRDCMADERMGGFIRRAVMEEIVPMVHLPRDEVKAFAESVFERFENPFIDHSLLSISLNSVSKWKARVLPSVADYYAEKGTLPRLLTFSFAALLAFYTGTQLKEDGYYAKRADGTEYVIHDDRSVLEFFAANSAKPVEEFVQAAASNTAFWGTDLTAYPEFCETVTAWLQAIRENPDAALNAVLEA